MVCKNGLTVRFACLLVVITAHAFSLATAGEDGLGRWYPRGGCDIGKYRWPYCYRGVAVPQRPGHGYFPTYWRDWHENAEAIFSEPEHTILPKREKRKKERAVETLPEPTKEGEEEAPPPPGEPEMPPSEAPEIPSEKMELPTGQEPQQPSQPETQPGQEQPAKPPEQPQAPEEQPQAPPETPPAEPPGTQEVPTELPMPTAPSQPLPTTSPDSKPRDALEAPGKQTTPPGAQPGTEGPSLFSPQKRSHSLAQQSWSAVGRSKPKHQRDTLRALGAGFNAPATLERVEGKRARSLPPARQAAPALRDDADATGSDRRWRSTTSTNAAKTVAGNEPAQERSVVIKATYVDAEAAQAEPIAVVRIDQTADARVASIVDRKRDDRENPLRESAGAAMNTGGWAPARKNPLRQAR
jgi:hypothetical protein